MPLANSEGICKDEERIFMADKIKLELENRTVVGKKVKRASPPPVADHPNTFRAFRAFRGQKDPFYAICCILRILIHFVHSDAICEI